MNGVNSRLLSVCYLDAGGVKWRQRAKCRGETFWSSTAVGLKLWACGTKREGGREDISYQGDWLAFYSAAVFMRGRGSEDSPGSS